MIDDEGEGQEVGAIIGSGRRWLVSRRAIANQIDPIWRGGTGKIGVGRPRASLCSFNFRCGHVVSAPDNTQSAALELQVEDCTAQWKRLPDERNGGRERSLHT